VAFSGVAIAPGGWRLAAAVTVGAAAGLGTLAAETSPGGSVPPAVLAPVAGGLVGAACWCAATRRDLFARVYAWLLAALVFAGRQGSPAAWAGLGALAAATLVVQRREERVDRAGLAGFVGFALFLGALLPATRGIASGILAAESWSESMLERWVADALGRGASRPSGIEVARRLRISASDRAVLEIQGGGGYLREQVCDRFDGKRWSMSAELERQHLPAVPDADAASREILWLSPASRRVPVPAGTLGADAPGARMTGGWLLDTSEPPPRRLAIRTLPGGVLPHEPPPDVDATALPPDLAPAFRAFAREATAGASSPRGRADAAERYFRSGFGYSLDTDLAGHDHPLLVLLRERRPASCSYFAGAMTAMLRSVGIPARVVGGYLASETNPITRRTVVRERDAHAWVEVWDASQERWIGYDPTPASAREEALGLGGTSRLKALAGAAVSVARRAWLAFREDPLGVLAAAVISPYSGLAVVFWLAWRLVRRVRARRARVERVLPSADPRLARLHARYLLTLRRRTGLSPGGAETDGEFLERLRAQAGAEAVLAAERFLDAYRRMRYRGEPVDPATLETALRAVDRPGTEPSA